MTKNPCYTCAYADRILSRVACTYILHENKRRPCPPGHGCTVYKPKGGRRPVIKNLQDQPEPQAEGKKRGRPARAKPQDQSEPLEDGPGPCPCLDETGDPYPEHHCPMDGPIDIRLSQKRWSIGLNAQTPIEAMDAIHAILKALNAFV